MQVLRVAAAQRLQPEELATLPERSLGYYGPGLKVHSIGRNIKLQLRRVRGIDMGASEAKVLVISVEGMAIGPLEVLAQIDDNGLRNAGIAHPELLVILAEHIASRATLGG